MFEYSPHALRLRCLEHNFATLSAISLACTSAAKLLTIEIETREKLSLPNEGEVIQKKWRVLVSICQLFAPETFTRRVEIEDEDQNF